MTQPENNRDWHAALATHPALSLKANSDVLRFGLFDRRRFTLRGYNREAKAIVRSTLYRSSRPKKFIIVARSRSGTTLLKRLLNQVPGVMCDGELLSRAVLAPRRFVNNLTHRPNITAYGVKILTYQMLQVQRVSNETPKFFQSLVDDGFTLIHLRRETFGQVLSLVTARETSAYHIPPGHSDAMQEVSVDLESFAQQWERSKIMLDYEDRLFSMLPHLRLQYEEDLKGGPAHQTTVDKICDSLGIASAQVQADLTPTSQRTVITNREELQEWARVQTA